MASTEGIARIVTHVGGRIGWHRADLLSAVMAAVAGRDWR